MPDRRLFLKTGGLAAGWCALRPLRAAAAPHRRPPSLVVLLQRGANDGLNTVIPFGERRYRDLRPTLALAPPARGEGEAALDLDGFFAFHPALEPLMPLWDRARLAVVHAVGSPDPTRSHFDAQDYFETGTPGRKATPDGWMNRALQQVSAAGTPFRGVSLTATLPRALAGAASAVAVSDPARFGLGRGASPTLAERYAALYADAGGGDVGRSGREALDAVDYLRERLARTPASDLRYPRGRDLPPLGELARLIRADVGVELAFVEMGGWDHHAAQGAARGQHANRLRGLAGVLSAFAHDLGERLDDVVVVVATEFGRTARENGNRGTDHGHGGVALVLGGAVRGGRVYGPWPGLEEEQLYERRDLAVTTDFRDLLGELLRGHLGTSDLAGVFPGHAAAGVGLL